MNTYANMLTLILCGCMIFAGCSESVSTKETSTNKMAPVPVVNASELQELLQSSKEPVLVEFSVLTTCFRCNDMRPQVQQLLGNLNGRAEVVRIDFHSNQDLAASLGATVCPSYVFFSEGKPLWTENYPTSGGLLTNKVLQELTSKSQSQTELF